MSEEEYLKLCSECNKILLKVNEAKAVPWLHVIKEHPESIKSHEIIFNDSIIEILRAKIFLLIKNILNIFSTLIISLFKKRALWYSNNKLKKVDVLLVSHLVSINNIKSESDFYLGEMEIILRHSGINVATVYIDHIGMANENTVSKFRTERNIFLLPATVNINEELTLLKKAIKVLISLSKIKFKSKLSIKILNHSIIHSLSRSTIKALRIQRQISELLDLVKPKILLFTYEGHSWERLLAETSKFNSRNIISIGYQHNLLSRLQNASLRPLGFPYDPDFIFASGLDGKRKLTKYLLQPSYGIEVFGSNRAPSEKIIIDKKKHEICILVTPEGLLSECYLLFNYSMKCAELYPSLKFIWRLHPALPLIKLLKSYPIFKKIPKNIIISKNEIIDDINLSTHVLYRGSTAVIQALSKGLRPLYLSVPNEIPIDILYDLKSWKIILYEPENVSNLIFNEFSASFAEVKQATSLANYVYTAQSASVFLSSIHSLLLQVQLKCNGRF